MKKTLIALAALAATGAFAQVSVTGMIDVGYKTLEATGTAGTGVKAAGISDGARLPNNLRFQASEDLGGGMKANVWVETGFAATNNELLAARTGTSGLQYDGLSAANGGGLTNSTNRQSWVSVSGGFGEVRLGYQVNNLYTLSSQSGYNMTYEGLQGADLFHTHGAAIVGGTRGNNITYVSPEFVPGLKLTLQMGAGDGRATVEGNNGTAYDNASRTGLLVSYANGPVSAAVAHTRFAAKNTAGGMAAGTSIFGVTPTVPPAASDKDGSLTQVVAAYDFGVGRVAALMNTGTGNSTSGAGVVTASDYKSQQVTLKFPFGKAAVAFSVGTATVDTAAVRTSDVKGNQIALTYDLSKTAVVYVATGSTDDTGTNASTLAAKATGTILGLSKAF